MRKKVFGRKFSRGRGGRQALFKSLVRSLVLNDKIVTTKARAKAIQGEVDKLITLTKKQTLSSKRMVLGKLGNDVKTYSKLIQKASSERKSGFTSYVALAPRKGDLASMVKLEFVDKVNKPAEKTA